MKTLDQWGAPKNKKFPQHSESGIPYIDWNAETYVIIFIFTLLNTKQATLFVKNPEDRPESCAKYD